MPTITYPAIRVVGREVRTTIEVRDGDRVDVDASGTVDFGGAVAGIGAPVLEADGDDWDTPAGYPAVLLRKNSLILGLRSSFDATTTTWFQGGTHAGFTAPSRGYLSLAANDATPDDNSRGWSVVVALTTSDEAVGGWRLDIAGIEFVQSIQRSDNSVPLIAGKQTLVRVFVSSGPVGPESVPLDGSLEVTDTEGRSRTLGPVDAAFPRRSGRHDRNEMGHSMNFVLPPMAPGTARFRVRVSARGAGTRPGASAEAATSAEFVRGPVITIRPFLVEIRAQGRPAPDTDLAMSALLDARQRFPVAERRHIMSPERVAYLLPFDTWSDWFNLLHTLATFGRPNIGEPLQRDHLNVAFVTQMPGDPVGGIALYPPWIWVASAVCALSASSLAGNAERVAHELGHALGLHHVWCADRPGRGPYSAFLPATTEEPAWYARDPRRRKPVRRAGAGAHAGDDELLHAAVAVRHRVQLHLPRPTCLTSTRGRRPAANAPARRMCSWPRRWTRRGVWSSRASRRRRSLGSGGSTRGRGNGRPRSRSSATRRER
jgi:hypothetical protein